MTAAPLYRPSLSALEAVWAEHHSSPGLLSILQPALTQILVQPDHHLFLNMAKFVAMLVSELYGKEIEDEILESFTERILLGAHLSVNKFYSKETFDQNRYLDCVAAILSVWIDCTKKEDLIIPKIEVFTRQSHIHVLDVILQSVKMSGDVKCKLLHQIEALDNIDTYVKYTIASRGDPESGLHSQHPAEDVFRRWLLKHNITSLRSVPEFLESSAHDEDLLSSMCRPFYTLPPTSDNDTGHVEEEETGTLFFIDRGDKAMETDDVPQSSGNKGGVFSVNNGDGTNNCQVTEDGDVIDELKAANINYTLDGFKEPSIMVETSPELCPSAPLAPPQAIKTPSPTSAGEETVGKPAESEPCIKIRNRSKRRSKPLAVQSDVIVVKLPATPEKSREAAPVQQAAFSRDTAVKVDTAISDTPLTEEALASLPDKPSARKRGRRTSDESATSVDSVASRTRQRAKQVPLQAIVEQVPLQAILEGETGKEEVVAASARKSAKTSARKPRTPKVKSTPKAKSVGASVRNASGKDKTVEVVNETPQIPVRKTRSRKLNV